MVEALVSALGIGVVVASLFALTYFLASVDAPNANFVAFLIPMVSFFGFLLVWYHESQPPAQGDSQPGLVLLVGGTVTG
jgi:hypothetical protein